MADLEEPGVRGMRQTAMRLVHWATLCMVLMVLTVSCGGAGVGSTTSGASQIPSLKSSGGPSAAGRLGIPVVRPDCRPRDLNLVLEWHHNGNGLLGELRATNPGRTPCGLLVKPAVQPLGSDGLLLPTKTVVTDEERIGPNGLLPGRTAVAAVGWANWCGLPAGSKALVSWGGPTTAVQVEGPPQPGCSKPSRPQNLSATWFTGLAAP